MAPAFASLDAVAGAVAESKHENSAAKHYADHVWRMLHHSGGAIPKETSQLVSDVRSIAAGLGLAMAAMPNLSQSAMLAAQEGLTTFTKALYRYAKYPAEMVARIRRTGLTDRAEIERVVGMLEGSTKRWPQHFASGVLKGTGFMFTERWVNRAHYLAADHKLETVCGRCCR